MSRISSLFLCTALSTALAACGSNSNGGSGGAGGGLAGTGGSGTGGSGTGLTGTGGSGTGGGGAGGSTAVSATDLIPRDNTIPGWTVDPDNPRTSGKVAATATDANSTEALIDGAAADFFKAPASPTLFAWQEYLNATLTTPSATATLYILQMPSADQAAGLYTAIKTASLYVGKDWTDPSTPLIGVGSRIADTGDHWWINFYKGSFYVEVSIGPSYNPTPPYDLHYAVTKDAAVAFANAIAGQIK
jgi:hypothetical protein